ncbi:hypothetical protein EJD97_017794 [Solanum chilense]|uniref:AD domain-containing protein n=1 Tax=Solanum chilense TaxID=4083 RepID=A0A6N2CA91_SOLCI|nr:hypothetical protein EJD97_017794 [Solanum chilense]
MGTVFLSSRFSHWILASLAPPYFFIAMLRICRIPVLMTRVFYVKFDVTVHVTRLPVRWDKTVIVVMNEVRVSSPYLPESVAGGTPAANERVRKVLELERKRLQSRNTGQ